MIWLDYSGSFSSKMNARAIHECRLRKRRCFHSPLFSASTHSYRKPHLKRYSLFLFINIRRGWQPSILRAPGRCACDKWSFEILFIFIEGRANGLFTLRLASKYRLFRAGWRAAQLVLPASQRFLWSRQDAYFRLADLVSLWKSTSAWLQFNATTSS